MMPASRGLFTDDLDDDLAASRARIELEERDLLPRPQQQFTIRERDRDRGSEHGRTDVAGTVVVAPPQVVAIGGVAWCKLLENRVQVVHRARLELDGRDRRRRSDDEDSGDSGTYAGFRHGASDGRRDVV